MSMRNCGAIAAMVALALAGCGGGGGTCDGESSGLGLAEPGLVGTWDYTLAATSGQTMELTAEGRMFDRSTRTSGYWGLDQAGTLSVQYSLGSECPPTGTLMTAAGVTPTSTSISGTILLSPMPQLVGKTWSIERTP
jgi:hypothetical protein